MATIITSDCINCGACEPECPNTAIYAGAVPWELGGASNPAIAQDIFYIVPSKCTECVGFYDHEACAAVCPVDCCVPESRQSCETPAVLLQRARALHPELTFPTTRRRASTRKVVLPPRRLPLQMAQRPAAAAPAPAPTPQPVAVAYDPGIGRQLRAGGIRSGHLGRAGHLQGLQRAVLDSISPFSGGRRVLLSELFRILRAQKQAMPQRARSIRRLLSAARGTRSAERKRAREERATSRRVRPPKRKHSRSSFRKWPSPPSLRVRWSSPRASPRCSLTDYFANTV